MPSCEKIKICWRMLNAKNMLYWESAVILATFNFLCFYPKRLIRIILKENFPDEILLW